MRVANELTFVIFLPLSEVRSLGAATNYCTALLECHCRLLVSNKCKPLLVGVSLYEVPVYISLNVETFNLLWMIIDE